MYLMLQAWQTNLRTNAAPAVLSFPMTSFVLALIVWTPCSIRGLPTIARPNQTCIKKHQDK